MSKTKTIEISETLETCVKAYLLAKAHADTLNAVKTKIMTELLTSMPFYVSEKNQKRRNVAERVTDPKDYWLMCTEELHEFLTCCREEWEKLGYVIKSSGPEPWEYCCPALVAESTEREAARLVVEVGLEETVPPEFRETLKKGMQLIGPFREMLDLICGLVVKKQKIDVNSVLRG